MCGAEVPRLLWSGQILEDNYTLSDYGMGCQVVIDLLGKRRIRRYFVPHHRIVRRHRDDDRPIIHRIPL